MTSLMGAAGLGALTKSLLDHLLSRRSRATDLSERAVKTAEVLMARQDAALVRAVEDNDLLRTQLAGVLALLNDALAELRRSPASPGLGCIVESLPVRPAVDEIAGQVPDSAAGGGSAAE